MPKLAAWLNLDSQPASAADRRLTTRFLRYWEDLRGDQRFPSPTNLNFDDISEFIPYSFNVDLTTSARDPNIRFAGKYAARDCDGDVTNRRLSELPPQSLLAQTVRHVSKVVTSGEPVVVADRFVTAQNQEIFFRAIMLPFSSTGDQTDYVIGAVNCKSVPIAAAACSWNGKPVGANGADSERRSSARHATTQPQVSEPPAPAPSVRNEVSERIADIEKAVAAGRLGGTPQDEAPRSGQAEGAGKTERATRGQSIVVGSPKGGTGKSTTAMHLIVTLLYDGHKVGSIDLDSPQQTLSRYIENRQDLNRRRGLNLPMPEHVALSDPVFEAEYLATEFGKLLGSCDYVVIDTPASIKALSRWAHAWADKVITLINDSILGLDTLAAVDADARKVVTPGQYAKMVARARTEKAGIAGCTFDWIVICNRLSSLDIRSKQRLADTLQTLAASLDFRNEPGLSEQVFYRELFLQGLTLLDLRQNDAGVALSMSHVAARQELRALLEGLRLNSAAVSI